MNIENPTVSIGLPVRNGMPFVVDALDSLLSQSFQDFELIISDNASDDGTAELCEEYSSRDPRIRLYRYEKNVGGSENFNKVFREARGHYFKWAAADDVCLPEFLSCCLEVLNSDKNVVLCFPQTQLIDENGEPTLESNDHMHMDDPSAIERYRHVIKTFVRGNILFGLMRSDVLRKTSLMGAYPIADGVLVAELGILGQFYEVPERLFLRRLHKGTSVQSYKTLRERAKWFRPSGAGGGLFPYWRLVGEHMRAVHRLRLPFWTKIGCQMQIIHLLRRHRRPLFGELVQPGFGKS